MATLIERIREHTETVIEFVRLAVRHRGCLRCMNAELDAELDADRELLWQQLRSEYAAARLGPLDVEPFDAEPVSSYLRRLGYPVARDDVKSDVSVDPDVSADEMFRELQQRLLRNPPAADTASDGTD